ncbi:MAG TPA: LptA/OstA family protein [Xanthobacteraceae bacterium]|jgi:lipopolysaccharide export system protein LptA|nr:LptA/OstA family protein [Xanthobacteraceae bacterium]
MSVARVRHWRALVAVTAIVVACAVCAGEATAQKNQGPPNALQGFSQNRDEPVKIRAAALELREKDKMATFTGDVYVLQGDTEMRCKQLVVFYEEEAGTRTVKAAEPGPGGDRQIRRIEAKGNVVVSQKDQNATGDAATFNMRENTVTLVGNVVVTRGTDVLRGQRLVVDLTSGVSKMDQGRVEGLFQSGPRNAPDPRNAAEKNNTADKNNTAEKSSSADKR